MKLERVIQLEQKCSVLAVLGDKIYTSLTLNLGTSFGANILVMDLFGNLIRRFGYFHVVSGCSHVISVGRGLYSWF